MTGYIRHIPGRVLALLILLTTHLLANAQESETLFSGGLTQSPKAVGICASIDKHDHISSFSIVADLYKVLNGENGLPGVKMNYTVDLPIYQTISAKGNRYIWYAGPGVTAGVVRDFQSVMGVIGGLRGNVGFRTIFRDHFVVAAGFSADIAFHARQSAEKGTIEMKFYKNGVFRTMYPEVRLEYIF